MQANYRNIAVAAFYAAHFIALAELECASKTADGWSPVIWLALFMCQAALLATWNALGKAPGRFRKTILQLFGAGLIVVLVKSGLRNIPNKLIELIIAAFFGAGFLTFLALPWVIVQRRGFELVDLRESPQHGGGGGFQFSLRQTFVWTVIALLFAIGQWLHRVNEFDGGATRKLAPFIGLTLCVAWVLQFVSLMLLAGWAALSPGDCRGRLAIVLITALVFGPLLPSYIDGEPLIYGFFTALWFGYAALLSASLSFFRACDYRLVRVAVRR